MATFDYTAHNKADQIQKGTISARSRDLAMAALREKHLTPILVKESSAKVGLKMDIKLPGSGKAKTKDLVVFTREFSTMINAGVSVLRALAVLAEQSESPVLKKVLQQIIEDVQGGANLSDSFAKHPKVFSPIYINMVRAGEAGGILDEVLKRLATQQEKDAAIKNKIKAGRVYADRVTYNNYTYWHPQHKPCCLCS